MYQFIPLHSCDYLYEILIKINVRTDEGSGRNEIWAVNKNVKYEYLCKVGSDYQWNWWPDNPVG